MDNRRDSYQSPLVGRYTSKEMQAIWSDNFKFRHWRQVWHAIAKGMCELGVAVVTEEQVDEMAAHLDDIDYDRVAAIEKKKKHDVVSHKDAFGEVAPKAAGIIHYGCTSCDITDNVELIQIRESLILLRQRMVKLVKALLGFIEKHADLPTTGRTHLQKAQPTTVGKRGAMWAQDILADLRYLDFVALCFPFRGLKGATGTQSSFLDIFEGDQGKVDKLEAMVANRFHFTDSIAITGQTYPRKIDTWVISALASFGASVHKMALDIRLLQADGEMEEPFEEEQVGSSAMPHKRNPMRSERACSLARELKGCVVSALSTQEEQAFERTLDDSAGRRRYLPESFLLAEAITLVMTNVVEGLVVYPRVIEFNLKQELPLLASAKIIDMMVRKGGNRQEAHEALRRHTHAAQHEFRTEGRPVDLIGRIQNDEFFAPIHGELDGILDPKLFIGAAPAQARALVGDIKKILEDIEVPIEDDKTQLSV